MGQEEYSKFIQANQNELGISLADAKLSNH